MGKVKRLVSNIDKMTRIIAEINRTATLEVGWFDGAKYQDGTHVAYVAAIHEFGYSGNNLPPRPFMRPTISARKNKWRELSRSGVKQVLAGKMTVGGVLNEVGLSVSGDISKAITELSTPPIKDSTIASKKRKLAKGKGSGALSKPLVETSLMLSSLSHEVNA